MPDSIGSLGGRAALAACLTLTIVSGVFAQQPLATPPTEVEFVSRFDFQLSAAGLSDPDPRFSWDANWGADFDLVDYVYGRLAVLADYEAVIGDELQLFDPNQASYTLEVSVSARLRGTELAGVLHHVSRHLSDRANRQAVAYNALELRLLKALDFGKQSLELRVEGGPIITRAYVDYAGIAVYDSTLRRSISPHTGVYGRVFADYYVVDAEIAGRSNQGGARFEAGVRLMGKRGALDLFGGYEKVVDAYPLDRQSREWAFAGFRLVN